MLPQIDNRDELDLILWLLFLCDGKRGIEGIAKQLDVPSKILMPIARQLETRQILKRFLAVFQKICLNTESKPKRIISE